MSIARQPRLYITILFMFCFDVNCSANKHVALLADPTEIQKLTCHAVAPDNTLQKLFCLYALIAF